jgi:DNA-binding transcriptional ArsR family regulator
MQVSAPSLTPFLRTDVQGLMLAELLLHPEREFTITELAQRAGTSLPTAVREIERLAKSGFVTVRPVGRNRNVQANQEHPLFAPMQEIITYAYGPKAIIEPLVAELKGIDAAYIYGSWAARLNGIAGPNPTDIDVLIIGSPDRLAVLRVGEAASKKLGREVNLQIQTPAIWASDTDPFINTVKSLPLVKMSVVEATNEE